MGGKDDSVGDPAEVGFDRATSRMVAEFLAGLDRVVGKKRPELVRRMRRRWRRHAAGLETMAA
jgi:hypothetical protein